MKKEIPDTEFWIVSDGAELPRLKRVAPELGLISKTRFLGGRPRARTFEVLAECHVLVHPSLHDSGGWLRLEAMAAARPVICLVTGDPVCKLRVKQRSRFPPVGGAGPTLAGLYSQLAERRNITVPDDHVQPTLSPAA